MEWSFVRRHKRKKHPVFLFVLLAALLNPVCGMDVQAQPKRMPDGTIFDAEYYAERYPDVAEAYGTEESALYRHYLLFGKDEGRLAVAPGVDTSSLSVTLPSSAVLKEDGTVFDFVYYANRYPDLMAAYGLNEEALWQHYRMTGKREGRQCAPEDVCVNQIYAKAPDDTGKAVALGLLNANKQELDELTKVLRAMPGAVGVKAVSVDGTKGISFNSTRGFYIASVIKAPYLLYCYKEMEKNHISLNEKITYYGYQYNTGAGSINRSPSGTEFTLREVMYRTGYESDNTGYTMLYDHFGTEGYNQLMDSLQCPTLRMQYSQWKSGVTNEDMIKCLKAIYDYLETDTVYAKAFYKSNTSDKHNFLGRALPDLTITQKYGRDTGAYCNAGIVRTPQGDYLISVFLSAGDSAYAREQIDKAVTLIHKMLTS